jgi:micrococcal nuclease
VKYEEQIRAAVAFARNHGYGLWSGCATDAEGDTNELAPTAAPEPAAVAPATEPAPAPAMGVASGCDPSYPDVCIPPYLPDPHGFDGDSDGVGCESG